MSEYAIEMLGITKRFPGIIANDNITLQLKKGEIHALLGENGAGKSTLMSVLFGLYQPEEGEIHKDGKKVEIKDPNDANDLGIGMVHQHFNCIFTHLRFLLFSWQSRRQKAQVIKRLLITSFTKNLSSEQYYKSYYDGTYVKKGSGHCSLPFFSLHGHSSC